jgi:plastocyanin
VPATLVLPAKGHKRFKRPYNLMRALFLFFLVLGFLPLQARPAADTVVTVVLQAVPGLQFDLLRFQVRPGARVKLVFTNNDDMDHNVLITRPGARLEVVQAAGRLGEQGPKLGYVPASDQVLWSIPVVEPEQSKSITFTAPRQTGVYPYVCTYPGHGYIMFGAMYVSHEKSLPPLQADKHLPPGRAAQAPASGHGGHTAKAAPAPAHPYVPVAPYAYRVFIAGASPAAIAVHLPQSLSYCWDAAACRLRFAWQGGFLDFKDFWKGKGDAEAEVAGSIFFRDATPYPLRPGKPETIPAVDYKGYRLVNRYPEFHYTIDGTEVYELLTPKADGSGLVRTFRLPGVRKPLWFCADAGEGMAYEASSGKWQKGKLRLTARQARRFSITMTRKEIAK